MKKMSLKLVLALPLLAATAFVQNAEDLQGALKKQNVALQKGDVVLIRTG